MITKNENGEYALFDQGKLIGYSPVKYVNGVRVVASMYDRILAMQTAAQQEQIHLTLAAGLRSWDEQVKLRIQNVIDKSKQNDMDYLATAPSNMFKPATGKPGYSNHQDGLAYDFNVTGFPLVYAWLVKNAHAHGFVRTVTSERWHWEYLPGIDQFAYVPKTHATWDGLI
jgi:LAS superfamily LD-carboxypeptidase LdcB